MQYVTPKMILKNTTENIGFDSTNIKLVNLDIFNYPLGIFRWWNTVGVKPNKVRSFLWNIIMYIWLRLGIFHHLIMFKEWFFITQIYLIFSNCTFKYQNSHWWYMYILDYTLKSRFLHVEQCYHIQWQWKI